MKFIRFNRHGNFETRKLTLELLATSPNGQTLGQMRERFKVMDKFEQAGADGVALEDAEHKALVNVLETRSDFVITSRDLLAVVDGIIAAPDYKPE